MLLPDTLHSYAARYGSHLAFARCDVIRLTTIHLLLDCTYQILKWLPCIPRCALQIMARALTKQCKTRHHFSRIANHCLSAIVVPRSTCVSRLVTVAVYLPHIIVIHAILVPAADLLGIHDQRQSTDTELTLVKWVSNSMVHPDKRKRGPRRYLWITAAYIALTCCLCLVSAPNGNFLPLVCTTVAASARSLVCLHRTRRVRIPLPGLHQCIALSKYEQYRKINTL